jgi:hypothetical protein
MRCNTISDYLARTRDTGSVEVMRSIEYFVVFSLPRRGAGGEENENQNLKPTIYHLC